MGSSDRVNPIWLTLKLLFDIWIVFIRTESINDDQTQQRSLESAQEFRRRVHISVDQNSEQSLTNSEESNEVSLCSTDW